MAKVNEKEVKKLMEALDLTREEALEMLAFDSGEVENEEVEKIEEKAKEQEKPKKKGSSLDKVKLQKAKKKVDEVKEQLMANAMAMLQLAKVSNPQKLTASKITFKVGEEYFSISLTKHKAKPDGYHEE